MNAHVITKSFVAILVVEFCPFVVLGNFDPFMDSTLFSIKWQGPLELDKQEIQQLGDRHMMITTNHKEQYRCILPETLKDKNDGTASYRGPSATELVQPLFIQTHCSYRIESYWTYELCHGKHLKQYHESKEPGMSKVQEYYLGFGNHRNEKKDSGSEVAVSGDGSIPVITVDGIEFPYYEVIMSDGTKCDLTGSPRKAHVLYICQPEGRGEVYELKESSTCEYEVVVFTALLCSHPDYRAKTNPVNVIRCHAMLGSPMKPMELSRTETFMRYLQETGPDYFDDDEIDTGGAPERRKPKFHRKKPEVEETPPQQTLPPLQQQSQLGALTDKQTLQAFLSGSQCIRGGTGWWKHEICFGKFVKQFHLEKGRETKIYLGHWDKVKHIEWLRDNPSKRPRPAEGRKQVSQHYSQGDFCDLTGKPRQCEVRIKCLQNTQNSHAIVLSLAEPEACNYVLTVESALFCPILKDADANGLLDHLVI